MICIVDYGMGNTGSVKNALAYLGYEAIISDNPADFKRASHLILPGVGSFGEGMRQLRARNIIAAMEEEALVAKKPFLGICLGMQMLASKGEEGGETAGLGWINGTVKMLQGNSANFRLPHVGWNDINILRESKLLRGTKRPIFYFTHSYYLAPENSSIIAAQAEYGEVFAATIEQENIYGVQFHPEKSQQEGLMVLENFLSIS